MGCIQPLHGDGVSQLERPSRNLQVREIPLLKGFPLQPRSQARS